MLTVDRSMRITLEETLSHPWISALDRDQVPEVDLGEEFRSGFYRFRSLTATNWKFLIYRMRVRQILLMRKFITKAMTCVKRTKEQRNVAELALKEENSSCSTELADGELSAKRLRESSNECTPSNISSSKTSVEYEIPSICPSSENNL